jgi:hypothetical protein
MGEDDGNELQASGTVKINKLLKNLKQQIGRDQSGKLIPIKVPFRNAALRNVSGSTTARDFAPVVLF